jgi:hypothetical protein
LFTTAAAAILGFQITSNQVSRLSSTYKTKCRGAGQVNLTVNHLVDWYFGANKFVKFLTLGVQKKKL